MGVSKGMKRLLGGMVLEQLGDTFILVVEKFNFVFFFAIAAAYSLPFGFKKACEIENKNA